MKNMKSKCRKMRSVLVIAVIGLSILLLTGCENSLDPDPGSNPYVTGVVGKTETGDNVIVMDAAAVNTELTSMEGEYPEVTLKFSSLDAEYIPTEGDIICSGPTKFAPYGFLYKVKTVTTNDNGETVITTEMATIAEAAGNAEVDETSDLIFTEDDEVNYRAVRGRAAAGSDIGTLLKIPVDETVNGVRLNGSIAISSKLTKKAKFSGYKAEYFELSAAPRLKADLTASYEGKITKEIPIKIFEHEFNSIFFMIGFLPVWITPELEITAVVTVEGDVKVSAKLVEWDYSYVTGVRKASKNAKLAAFKEDTSKPAKYMENFQLTMTSAGLKVEPQTTFTFGLYSAAKAEFTFGAYARLESKGRFYVGAVADTNPDPNAELSLYCGIEFGVGAKLEILEYDIGSVEHTFDPLEWLIWKWVKVTGVTINPATAEIAVGGTRTLTATVLPSTATNKNVTWTSTVPQTASVTDGVVSAVRAGTATITVTTSDGGYTATCTVTVTAGGGSGGDTSVPVPITMVDVPGGTFQMGKNLGSGGGSDVTPIRTITMTGFKMSKYVVTQAQWKAVMGTTITEQQALATTSTRDQGRGNNYPMYYVSWYEALVFCNKLSMSEGLSPAYSISGSTNPASWGSVPGGYRDRTWDDVVIVSGSTGYRLPTEAQWEYAAKGGNGSPGNYTYAGSNDPDAVAWYSGNNGNIGTSTNGTKTVGTKAPNGLGLYDMSGNVEEWCWDLYGDYKGGAQTDPVGSSDLESDTSYFHVTRGGTCGLPASFTRSVSRSYAGAFSRPNDPIGFRLVRP